MMATIDELRNIAHDLYVRAGTSIDPSTKRMLMTAANDYVKQAEELHRSLIVRETELSEYFSATFGGD